MKKDCKKCAFAKKYYSEDGETLLICSVQGVFEYSGLSLFPEVSNFNNEGCLSFKEK